MVGPSRTGLINAARRSMLQRSQLRRKLGVACDAFAPAALVRRAKYRVGETIDDTAQAVRDEFRRNRLPIAPAAVAGNIWLLRGTIKTQPPRFGGKLRDLADATTNRLRPDNHDE